MMGSALFLILFSTLGSQLAIADATWNYSGEVFCVSFYLKKKAPTFAIFPQTPIGTHPTHCAGAPCSLRSTLRATRPPPPTTPTLPSLSATRPPWRAAFPTPDTQVCCTQVSCQDMVRNLAAAKQNKFKQSNCLLLTSPIFLFGNLTTPQKYNK